MMSGEPTLKNFAESLELELISGTGTHNLLLLGRQGWGQKELLRILARNLRNLGHDVFEGFAESVREVEKYEPFNQILDSVYGENRVRELNDILSGIRERFRKGGKAFMFFSNINLLSDPTRYLLTYFMKSSYDYGISIICSCATDSELRNGDLNNFLDVVNGEELAKVFNLSRPKLEDFRFVLSGNSFPEDFINDIYRLSDSNFAILDYILKYYKFKGVIMDSGEIDLRIYRFMVIPTEISQFLKGMVDSLDRNSQMILALLSFLQIMLDPGSIGGMLGIGPEDAKTACSDLERRGLVIRLINKFGMPSRFINTYFRGALPGKVLDDALNLAKRSPVFKHLPLEARVQILDSCGDYGELSSLIKNEWRSFVRKFTDVQAILNFVKRVQDQIEDQETRNILSLIRCNAIYNSDDLEMARKCYETTPGYETDPVGVTLTLASIYQAIGNYRKSIDILVSFDGENYMDKAALGFMNLLIAEAAFGMGDYDLSRQKITESMKSARESSDRELEARILTLEGNIYLLMQKNRDAEDKYILSSAINQELGIWLQLSRNLNNLSVLYSTEGRYDQALSILNRLIDNTYLTGDTTLRATAYHSKARLYDIMGKRYEVLENTRRSILASRITGNYLLLMRNRSLLFWHHIRDLSYTHALETLREAIKEAKGPYAEYFTSLLKFMEIIDGSDTALTETDFEVPNINDGFDRFQFRLISLVVRVMNSVPVDFHTEYEIMKEYLEDEPEMRGYIGTLRRIIGGDMAVADGGTDNIVKRLLELLAGKGSGENDDMQRFLSLGNGIPAIMMSVISSNPDKASLVSSIRSLWRE